MISLQTNPLGIELLHPDFYMVFGNKQLARSTYKADIQARMGEKLNFHYVNQVHGDGVQIIENQHQQPEEADAMITDLKKSALLIKTADCLPILIFDKKNKKIAAVHAGWRGVLNDICLKCIRLMAPSNLEDLEIYIGPHIMMQSFQVKDDLIGLFQSKFPFISEPTHFVKDLGSPGHFFINLEKILKDRLYHESQCALNIQTTHIDSFRSESIHSYRRDADESGRNLSLIYLR